MRVVCLILTVSIFVASGCRRSPQLTRTGQVEVAPDTYVWVDQKVDEVREPPKPVKAAMHALNIHVGRVSGPLEFWVEWQGARVHWKGKAFPVTLRAYEQKLYFVVWDMQARPTDYLPEPIFRYYVQHGSEFEEIDAAAFPRSIATQNLFWERYFMTDRPRDGVLIARDLDPTDDQFCRSMTAKLWCHLATGQQYYESPSTIKQTLLEAFIRSNRPVKLALTNYFSETNAAPPAVQDQNTNAQK